jgi:phosphoribosylglycinamide formyltransferase-1
VAGQELQEPVPGDDPHRAVLQSLGGGGPPLAAEDAELADAVAAYEPDLVVCAGFMRVLGPAFVRAFDGRILNVHPALLPSFPGAHAVADALAYGAKVTGVTVHLVDEEVDHGPIVFQEAIAIGDEDDWDTVEPRVHEVEHRLLPAAVRALVEGRLKVDGRRVHVLDDGRRER